MIILRQKEFGKVHRAIKRRPYKQLGFKNIENLPDYVNKNRLNFRKASKFQRINARPAIEGETIKTVASDGVNETINTAKKGSYVVNNVGNDKNQWIIEGNTFAKKYELDRPGVYRPKGGPMNATKLNQDVKFKAPWGEEMKIKKGGYLLQDPKNKSDIYGISGEDFKKTYKFNNKPTLIDRLKEKGKLK